MCKVQSVHITWSENTAIFYIFGDLTGTSLPQILTVYRIVYIYIYIYLVYSCGQIGPGCRPANSHSISVSTPPPPGHMLKGLVPPGDGKCIATKTTWAVARAWCGAGHAPGRPGLWSTAGKEKNRLREDKFASWCPFPFLLSRA